MADDSTRREERPGAEQAAAEQPERRTDALGLDVAEMRHLGYWVVDRVVEHFEAGRDGPAIEASSPAQLRAALGGELPHSGQEPLLALQQLVDVALQNMQHGDHPRYFARVPGPSSFAGVLGEWLGSGFNAIATSWAGGSGPATVELVALDWLRQLLGLPDGTEGIALSGGSIANLTGLAAARDAVGPGVAYLSDQTHASIVRALHTLGFDADHVRVLDSDGRFQLTAASVRAEIAADRACGRVPRFVVATAGTTNTGAVDELAGLAELAAAEGLWLHVDGAYGAPAALTPKGRATLAGIARADSLVLDPHKWLFQPYDIGCLFVRRPSVLEHAYSIHPEYLADIRSDGGRVNFGDRSLELTRRSRALKLWLTFRIHGVDGLRAAIARGIELAEHAEQLVRADTRWELVTPAQLGIVTFAGAGWAPERHAASAAAASATGEAAVTSTRLRGRSALRLCTINPLTSEADIERTLALLAGA
ncbi:MAG: pyridoxal phosphate-dependent decarboxylase family protein [Solirubrobacteraceae bacterium]